MKEKVKIDKGEVANELFKTKTSERMNVILKELSTLLYETNIRLNNSSLMYNYIINQLFKSVDKGRLAYQTQTMEWTTTHLRRKINLLDKPHRDASDLVRKITEKPRILKTQL